MEHRLNLEDFELDEIVSIEYSGLEDTIDIVVEGTRMFFANDIYTHNSGFENEVNDIAAIGKAIEPFQVADMVITYAQNKTAFAEKVCYALLLKNRFGTRNILLKCYYDPNMGIFDEIEVVNELLLLSESAKNKIKDTALSIRDRAQRGDFDKKK